MANSDVQINENCGFQAGFWRAQRVAWVLLAAVLAAALLGLAGGGGLYSYRSVGDDAFTIRYPVIARQQSQDEITITLAAPKAEAVVHLDTAFHDAFTIVSMSPAPTQAFATSWGVAYRFAVSGAAPATVRIVVSANSPRQASYTIVADGRMAMLSTLILP